MSSHTDKIKSLANALRDELHRADQPDEDVLLLLRNLEADLQGVIDRDESNDIIDLLSTVESRFAVDHPVVERTVRELIDTLNKIGI